MHADGMGSDNLFFHTVYGRLAQVELGELGFNTTYERVTIKEVIQILKVIMCSHMAAVSWASVWVMRTARHDPAAPWAVITPSNAHGTWLIGMLCCM